MHQPRGAPPPLSAPVAAPSAAGGFVVVLSILGSMFIAARPLAFMHYSAESAYAALLAICFVAIAGVAALRERSCRAPENLVLAFILWTGVFVWGAQRSPYLGEGIPLATDAIFYGLMLLAGYFSARIEPSFRVIFIRAIVAMAAVEAAFSLWQVFVELPRLRKAIDSGEVLLPEALASKIGLDRLGGNLAQGTFGNPNSLAGFLLVGFFLLLGHCWEPLRARFWGRVPGTKPTRREEVLTLLNCALAALLLAALFATDSKGAWVAFGAGAWFFAIQILIPRYRFLKALTINGISAGLMLIALTIAGVLPTKLFGLSMSVRFEYWKAAWAMFWRHPLQGVGLGGYGEWYTHFKTPMGWEVKDPHNEYLCFLAELGILGLLVYVLVWRLIFKHATVPSAPAPAAPPTAPEPRSRLSDPGFLSMLFGMLSLYLAIFAVGVFNSPDIINLMRREWSGAVIAGALQTLLLPIFFVLVVHLLRTDFKAHAARTGAVPSVPPALLYGFRAAAGAVLVHQLVDFDFKAPAVMCALLLCGGLFWGGADAVKTPASEAARPRPVLSRLSVWLAPVCALLLIPTGVWVPLQTSAARADADDAQTEYFRFENNPLRESTLEPEELEKQIVAAWQRAAGAAPYDAVPLTVLSDAKYRYENARPGSTKDDELLTLLRRAERLRPLSSNIKLKLATLYFRRGVQEAGESTERSRKSVELALEKFREARVAYPLRPAHSLMEGDALLFLGYNEEANACYVRAFEIDVIVNDPNVYLSSIFTDPRPSAYVNHNQNVDVLQLMSPLLRSTSSAAPAPAGAQPQPLLRFGLFVRHMVGLAQQLDAATQRRYRNPTPAEMEAINRQKVQLLKTTEELAAIAPEGPMRAHAALLHSLCVKAFPLPRKNLVDTLNLLPRDMLNAFAGLEWHQRCQLATERAIALQAESVKQGRPGTTPWVFSQLLNVLRK